MTEIIFEHKYIDQNGDIIEIKILKVPKTTDNLDGVSYSLVYIKEGKLILGYDNFEGHRINGNCNHKHINNRLERYEFIDEWKLIDDFMKDVEKIKKRSLK